MVDEYTLAGILTTRCNNGFSEFLMIVHKSCGVAIVLKVLGVVAFRCDKILPSIPSTF